LCNGTVSKEGITAFEILLLTGGLLSLSRISKEQTDKVKHTSEQSGANIFSSTDAPVLAQDDNSMALIPAVDINSTDIE